MASTQNTQSPTYELQEWDWSVDQWTTVETYDTNGDNRAEGNAYYAYKVHRSTGPHRLLKDGKTVLGDDDPDAYYRDAYYRD